MIDQANELRKLVRHETDRLCVTAAQQPWFLAVSGGRDGGGTTTVALNLAIGASQQGRQVLLVDADANRGDLAAICRLEQRHTLSDVLSARRSVREAIQPGPAGIWVLAGGWTNSTTGGSQDIAPGQFIARLVHPLKAMGQRFDTVVIDAGNGANSATAERRRAADAVLMVTTTELPSVMDAYASVKDFAAGEMSRPVHCLVNMAADDEAAGNVFGRLERSCRRFLGIRLENAGYLPEDPHAAELIQEGRLVAQTAGPSPLVERLKRLAESLIPKQQETISQQAG